MDYATTLEHHLDHCPEPVTVECVNLDIPWHRIILNWKCACGGNGGHLVGRQDDLVAGGW